MNAPLRVGVVGLGTMGRAVLELLRKEPGVALTDIATSRPLAARRILGEATTVRIVANIDELLATDVEVVVIATPDATHGDLAQRTIRAGKHFLCEKPLATSESEAAEIVRLSREAEVIGMCLFNHRWLPAYAKAKELARDLGPAILIHARKSDVIDIPTKQISWADQTTPAWFLSSHDIDLVSWLIDDRVVEVHAVANRGLLEQRGIDTADAVLITATFSRGAIATFSSSWVSPTTYPTPVDSFVELIFHGGLIRMDRQSENLAMATTQGYTYPRTLLQNDVNGGAYAHAIRHFLDCCRTDAPPLVSLESSWHVTAVLAAAHESIRSGSSIRVEPGLCR